MTLRVKHSYNAGDLISILPGLKAHYERTGIKTTIYQYLNFPGFYYEGATHPVKHNDQMVCMSLGMYEMLKPLITDQQYIESFEIWEGQQVDLDFDATRDRRFIPLPYSDIYQWPVFLFPDLHCDTSRRWLDVPVVTDCDTILVNITERYNNPYISYFFLKPFVNKLIFVGTACEHKAFCEKWGLFFPHREVSDFYELAQVIKSCKFGLYNQSMCFHIANGLKTPRILEVCPQFPNTLPAGKDGYSCIYQESLEHYFHQLNQQ